MREGRAWVGPNAAIDLVWVPEPITEGVQVVDGHNAQREPAQLFLPRHPMRNATHFDRCEDWFADDSVLQQRLAGADGVVESHILVDYQLNAGRLATFHRFDRFPVIHA